MGLSIWRARERWNGGPRWLDSFRTAHLGRRHYHWADFRASATLSR